MTDKKQQTKKQRVRKFTWEADDIKIIKKGSKKEEESKSQKKG